MATRKPASRRRIASTLVYEAIKGRPTDAARELGVSAPTLARWRKEGVVRNNAAACLLMAEWLEPKDLAKRWAVARRLAGLDT